MNRYHLEFILNTHNDSLAAIKENLSTVSQGMEVDQLSSDNLNMTDFKFSLFTMDPTIIFDTCAEYGRIKSIKISEA